MQVTSYALCVPCSGSISTGVSRQIVLCYLVASTGIVCHNTAAHRLALQKTTHFVDVTSPTQTYCWNSFSHCVTAASQASVIVLVVAAFEWKPCIAITGPGQYIVICYSDVGCVS